MKLVNVGNALKVTCVGFAAGVLLRVVQMLYFFDYDTGFYTDGGVMAWISLALPWPPGCWPLGCASAPGGTLGPMSPGRT